MKLERLEETELIRAIRKEFAVLRRGLILGIGDDAAVLKEGKKYLILTKDLLIEDIHFITALHPPRLLGKKSLNVNLSDIAAMGGSPKYALLGLSLPSRTPLNWLEEYFSGFNLACRQWGVALIGGDVSQSQKITISVTVVGQGKNIIARKGAKPGHLIFVSGYLGDAKQGFLLLRKGFKLGDNKKAETLLRAFLDPSPQLHLAQELSRHKLASSMIDTSDGLSVDLFHLCEESRCGAEVEKERLPISPQLRFWQKKPFDFALHGGEDYQLLFSVPPRNMESVLRLRKKYRLTCIGRFIRKKGLYILDQNRKKKPLPVRGYQHFKAR